MTTLTNAVPSLNNPADAAATLQLALQVIAALTPQQPAPAPQPAPIVGTCADNEELLVYALYNSEQRGLTYRQALEGLHGTNNHDAGQWKDYYLDNTQRIDRQVDYMRGRCDSGERQTPVVTAKKPPMHAFDSSLKRKAAAQGMTVQVNSRPVQGTARSRSVHMIRLPTPPPPTEEIGIGHKWTEEDMQYLIKLAHYCWAKDPNVTRNAICKTLSEQAPHHTFWGWLKRWQAWHAYIEERINALGISSGTGVVVPSLGNKPDVDSEADADKGHLSEPVHDTSDGDSDEDNDAERMAQGGTKTNTTDRLAMARYVALYEPRTWNSMSNILRWDRFTAVYPHRNSRSWANIYSRDYTAIDRLAARRRARNKEQGGEQRWVLHSSLHPKSNKRARRSSDCDQFDHKAS